MQKQNLDKLKLFLIGINARLKENIDYFIDITMEFTLNSGVKKAIVKLEGDNFTLKEGKRLTEISMADIGEFFIKTSAEITDSILIYRERGSMIEIKCTAKNVTMKQSEEQVFSEEANNPLIAKRDYIIDINKAENLLKGIGILTKEGKLKNDMIRKYNQIDHYVELVAPMFRDHHGEIVILDCCCGKSYLSFVLNYYIRDVLKKKCRVIGVDISENVIEKSRGIAKELNYNNMEFICADLNDYNPPSKVTMVISLHACDIATDLALGTAIRVDAKYIACVPCCHKELLDKYKMPGFEGILKHGIFRARMNDLLTDGMRALKLESLGYKVSVVEYISPLDTPKNILIRAEKATDSDANALESYEAIRRMIGTFSEFDKQCMLDSCSYDL